MEYVTTETTGKEGYPVAQAMWIRVFPSSADFIKKCPWYYENKNFSSSIYLLRELGEKDVLGAISSVSRSYNSKNGEQVVGLCADFAVDKKHQSLVPALKLVKSLIKGSHEKCDILLGFPNNKSVNVMCRAGFRLLGELPRYALILKSKPYIKETHLSRFGTLITVPVDLFLRFYFWVSRCKHFSDYELTEVFSADELFDKLWTTCSEQNDLYIGKRDRTYLNWRFFANPINKSRIFVLKQNKTHELVGYAVFRVNAGGHWYAHDFFALSGNKILKCLMQKVIATAIKENAISLSIEFLGNKEVTQLLDRLKFSKRISERRVVLAQLKESNEYQKDIYDINNWFITSADELG